MKDITGKFLILALGFVSVWGIFQVSKISVGGKTDYLPTKLPGPKPIATKVEPKKEYAQPKDKYDILSENMKMKREDLIELHKYFDMHNKYIKPLYNN